VGQNFVRKTSKLETHEGRTDCVGSTQVHLIVSKTESRVNIVQYDVKVACQFLLAASVQNIFPSDVRR